METWVAKLHYLSFIVNLIFQIRKWLKNCSYIRIPCLFDTEDEYGDAVDDGDRIEDNAVGSGLTPTLQLCSAHKPGQMIEVCKTCAAALAMGRPEVAKQLIVPVPVTALTRYSTRSGEKQPSLFLPAGFIELAVNTFNADMFRSICVNLSRCS